MDPFFTKLLPNWEIPVDPPVSDLQGFRTFEPIIRREQRIGSACNYISGDPSGFSDRGLGDPFRSSDGALSPELAKFTVKSGILSWGQIIPMYYNLIQDNVTNNAGGAPNPLPGGTIKQHVYMYKSAARVGDWKVRQYYSDWAATDPCDPDGEKHPAG